MIYFKNHNGFTLLETVFALAIAAIVLTPLFILQGTLLQRVSDSAIHMQRLFFAKDFLYRTHKETDPDEQEVDREKKIEDPAMIAQYTLKSIEKKSSLAGIPGLLTQQVKYSWQWQGRGYSDNLVTFIFKPQSD